MKTGNQSVNSATWQPGNNGNSATWQPGNHSNHPVSFKTHHMYLLAQILIGIIAALHLYILYFEMFAWTTRGRKVFRKFPKELFEQTKVLAANQGLYNGFLAAGLLWTFFIENTEWQKNVALFFLTCVAVAGIYGAATADKKIFFVQALPALIAITLVLIRMS